MNTLLFISIIESVYIFYMFNIFKTRFSIHHPFEYLISNTYIKHPIYTGKYENKICTFGHHVSILIIIWFILRNYITHSYKNKINTFIIHIILFSSLLLNM